MAVTRELWMANRNVLGVDSLAEAEHRAEVFRLLVESVQDYAIFVLDTSGHVVTWNAGAQRIKQYTSAEILGRHFSVFYPPSEVAKGVPDGALKTAAAEGHWQNEGWRVRKDGSRFWASVVITALRNSEGDLVGYTKVTRDLTAHREAEVEREQLLENERAAHEQAERSFRQLRSIQSLTEAALSHLELDDLLDAL